MNIVYIFMLTAAIHVYNGKAVNSKKLTRNLSKSKPSRETEAFTSIILNNESFSIKPVISNPRNYSELKQMRQNSKEPVEGSVLKSPVKFSDEKLNRNHNKPHSVRVKPALSMTLAKNTATGVTKNVHIGKKIEKQLSQRRKNKRTNMFKKRMHIKRFIGQKNNFRNTRDNAWAKQEPDKNIGRSHLFVLAPASSTIKAVEYSRSPYQSGYFQDTTTLSENSVPVEDHFDKDDLEDVSDKSTEGTEDSSLYRRDNEIAFNKQHENYAAAPWMEPNFQPNDSPYHLPNHQFSDNLWKRNQDSMPHREYRNSTPSRGIYDITSTSTEMTSTIPKLHEIIFTQADIIQRSLISSTKHPKSEQEKLEDQLRTDESGADDTVVRFGVACHLLINQTCWMESEVGDVATLAVNIESSKEQTVFQIRWIKMYHVFDSAKSHPLELLPGKLPWNMVSGSESRELRLNPVTNIDIDPNYIVAKVFMVSKHRGKSLFTQLKKLVFRIDIPIIDMGEIYAGEELFINIENFISLPERGNMLFDWKLEAKPHHMQSLPSNVKVSNSGRSVVLKELKKGRLGVLNCVVYSASRIAVAKRRFNILKIADSVKRRAPGTNFDGAKFGTDMKRSLSCRRIIRRSHEKALHRLEEGMNKSKSRKKRFKRKISGVSGQSELECGPLKKKLYSRWVRSLFRDFITEDPRVMPIEKLFELSEDGDGTLDKIIPHEVHYVQSEVKYVPGTSLERYVNQVAPFTNCTSDTDCGEDATCVMNEVKKNSSVPFGSCFCRPAFYGDGETCRKIPHSYHREKRLRRHLDHGSKDFSVPEHLFYEHPNREVSSLEPREDETSPPKVLAFEEEESFLLSDCMDDKDCSCHANCIQATNGHPYCKCRPGFRGNGIFCWEIIDYVPPEELFLPDDELEQGRPTLSGDMHMTRLVSRTPTSEEMEGE